jgi:hypothetical protein
MSGVVTTLNHHPGRQVSEMASFLNKQKQESLDALTCAADAEGRLHTANERSAFLSLSFCYSHIRD